MLARPLPLLACLATVLALALPPAAVASDEVVLARGTFVSNGDHVFRGAAEVVRLADGGLEVRFTPEFHFTDVPPAPLRPIVESPAFALLPPPAFDVRVTAAANPANPQAALASTPLPGLLGMPDAALGPLQAFDGAQAYALPAGTDVAALGSVVVYCITYGIVMGHADLVPA